ncbi:MAG TPA: family 1 glycosylhydrolase [Actinomycetota bacterium]|nr:family 1 glycosylhydrolase [Actinomycetota bacterium]
MRCPTGFLWGVATSAHQVEGGQTNDWTEWEALPGRCSEPSGIACDHYRRFDDDIALIAELGFNTYRFSLEWSRIEPAEGEFDHGELDHYLRMVESCHRHGIRPFPTFHHFTNPLWIARDGAWENPRTPDRFARFCEVAARRLAGSIDTALTINEPNMPPLLGYELGWFPPGLRDRDARVRATEQFVTAHHKARAAIRDVDSSLRVGWAVAMTEWTPVDGGEITLDEIRRLREDVFLDASRDDDFIGVNVYTRHRVSAEGVTNVEDGVELTAMGYEFWPDALEAVVRRTALRLPTLPILVTENGIATDDDSRRAAFVEEALRGLTRCLRDGIDVRGYLYWTALDNFEWHHGYGPKFGLIAVDRETQERRPKPSARWLGRLAAGDVLPEPLDRPL